MTSVAVHAGCIAVGTLGVLIRGPSGSGKSMLADALLQAAREKGHFAALVADDRTQLRRAGDRLIAAAPVAIAGLMEVRGHGIVDLPFEPSVQVRLVLDIVDAKAVDRLPETPLKPVDLEGVQVPAAAIARGDLGAMLGRVRWAVHACLPESPLYI